MMRGEFAVMVPVRPNLVANTPVRPVPYALFIPMTPARVRVRLVWTYDAATTPCSASDGAVLAHQPSVSVVLENFGEVQEPEISKTPFAFATSTTVEHWP